MKIICIFFLYILCAFRLYSNDLSVFELRGPVKSVTQSIWGYSCLESKFFFTNSGILYESTFPASICRDQHGNLQWGGVQMQYNDKKQIIKVSAIFSTGILEIIYFYNNKGLLVRCVKNLFQSDNVTQFVYNIVHTRFDSYDNWVMRILTDIKTGEKTTETRVIEYYDSAASTNFSENNDISDNKEVPVYSAVEQMPEFPGGEEELMKYISRNIKYPTMAMENNIQGRVVVQFVVTKTGKIGEVKVVRSKDPDLDKEAVRVVKSLPNFIPGKMNGQAVNVWYTLPITFNIEETQ